MKNCKLDNQHEYERKTLVLYAASRRIQNSFLSLLLLLTIRHNSPMNMFNIFVITIQVYGKKCDIWIANVMYLRAIASTNLFTCHFFMPFRFKAWALSSALLWNIAHDCTFFLSFNWDGSAWSKQIISLNFQYLKAFSLKSKNNANFLKQTKKRFKIIT